MVCKFMLIHYSNMKNKNARRPKEAHIKQNFKILDWAGEDLKDLAQY